MATENINPENIRHTRLQKLSDSDFEMVDGEPDIRGWDVKDDAGKLIGEVEELIFDYESRKVRYLVVDLDDNDFGMTDREVLVPIGIAELHESDDDVILNDITVEQLLSLPDYDEDRFDTEHETSVRNVFGGLGAAQDTGNTTLTDTTNLTGTSHGDDFYDHEQFNDRNLYRNRNRVASIDNNSSIPPIQNEFGTGSYDMSAPGSGKPSDHILDNEDTEYDQIAKNSDTYIEPTNKDDYKKDKTDD